MGRDSAGTIFDLNRLKMIRFKVKEEHRFNSGKFNCIIASMDYWENHFAKVIQKNFLISRYNPRYTICKNVLNRQFDEFLNNCNSNDG